MTRASAGRPLLLGRRPAGRRLRFPGVLGLRLALMVSTAAVVLGSVLVLLGLSPGASSRELSLERPLYTAFFDPFVSSDPSRRVAFGRVKAAGASLVRLSLYWDRVAPGGDSKPPRFEPRDPGDPLYSWTAFDQQVRAVVAAGLSPMLFIDGAPGWAQDGRKQRTSDGPVRPSPAALADFATAAAKRYAGGFHGLPRVRYWQVWNEPNLSIEFMPQQKTASPCRRSAIGTWSTRWPRRPRVHRDNVVVAGGLAPFGGDINDPSGGRSGARYGSIRWTSCVASSACRPARSPTDLRRQGRVRCLGAPPVHVRRATHKAYDPDDVSLGDLRQMRSLLNAAERAGHVSRSQTSVSG